MANTISVLVKQEVLVDLLISAVEGGSLYWARYVSAVAEPEGKGIAVRNVVIEDVEADEPKEYNVTPDIMLLGLQRLAERINVESVKEEWHLKPANAARILGVALSGEHDAGTADIVLQMGLFGEVLYG